MRKLSTAQEKILRQVADGKVKLVYIGDNEHSTRRWDAIDRDGKRCNRQYDALHKAALITTPYANWTSAWDDRITTLTSTGAELLQKTGPAGRLMAAAFADDNSSWMLRDEIELGSVLRYVIYKNGQVYDRFRNAQSAWTVFRSHCPFVNDLEASLSR